MILNHYRCTVCEARFEHALPHMTAPPPACPRCDAAVRKVFNGVNIGGRASTGPSREEMPSSWRALGGGDKEVIAGWRERAIARDRLEERHPELAGDRRPVLAHEGIFAGTPLRAGDPFPGAAAQGTGASPKPESAGPESKPGNAA